MKGTPILFQNVDGHWGWRIEIRREEPAGASEVKKRLIFGGVEVKHDWPDAELRSHRFYRHEAAAERSCLAWCRRLGIQVAQTVEVPE